ERPAAGAVPAAALPAHLRELADAGADEAILVVDPITERSIRELGAAVAAIQAPSDPAPTPPGG
ncbi:MAG: hypothetical protein QOE86_2481, partial [Solirubrobacteraceae bacterium]|nr:hypothetical protein [Solirubrobacteraceae bacterium]